MLYWILFVMLRRPPRSTRTDTRFPTRRSSDLMDQAGSDGCPDCDMGKAAMQGAACQSVCIAMPIALPETPGVLAMAHADPVPRQPTLGSGMIRSPDPHPPRSGLRA